MNEERPAHEKYLPQSKEEWEERVNTLIAALRQDNLIPLRGDLYRQSTGGAEMACIGGIVNRTAVDGGLPAVWIEGQWQDEHTGETLGSRWDLAPPDRGENNPFGLFFEDALSVAVPEACIYHGLNIQEGLHYTDCMEFTQEFRLRLTEVYGSAMGYQSMARTNDHLARKGVNPLHWFADVLEHMLQQPDSNFWHPAVREWTRSQEDDKTPRADG